LVETYLDVTTMCNRVAARVAARPYQIKFDTRVYRRVEPRATQKPVDSPPTHSHPPANLSRPSGPQAIRGDGRLFFPAW